MDRHDREMELHLSRAMMKCSKEMHKLAIGSVMLANRDERERLSKLVRMYVFC